jgi:hypothetical protein
MLTKKWRFVPDFMKTAKGGMMKARIMRRRVCILF